MARSSVDFPTPWVPMKCTLPSSFISAYGTWALFMNMILLRYLIFYVFVYVNTKNYLLDVMKGISHLIGAIGFVHHFGNAHTLHRSRQCLQFLAIRQFAR